MRSFTLIVKPTNACVARCVYCSAHKAGSNPMMTREMLRTIVSSFADYADEVGIGHIDFTWHGGEPLLAGIGFYQLARELQETLLVSRGIGVRNHIQSNLLLLDRPFAQFLKGFLTEPDGTVNHVGTSFDPIEGIRVMPGGDYDARWHRSRALLEEVGIPYGMVYVAHRGSLPRVAEIYGHFRDRFPGRSVRYNPIYRDGLAASTEGAEHLITAREWGEFLVALYRLWEQDDKKPGCSPLGEYDGFHHRGSFGLVCDSSGTCIGSHLGIDADGSVHSCGRGIDEGSLAFGNLATQRLRAILESPRRRAIGNRIAYLKMTSCRDCAWWQYCHGGCGVDALLAGGRLTDPTGWCESRRHFFETVYGTPRAADAE